MQASPERERGVLRRDPSLALGAGSIEDTTRLMVPALLRLFRPQGPDRVAVISVEPSARGDFNINLGRGPRLDRLSDGTTYGPYREADLETPHAQLLTSLKSEGFL